MPHILAQSKHAADPANAKKLCQFRGKDKYSVSDKRTCLRLATNEQAAIPLHIDLPPTDGIVELRFTAMPELMESHSFARKHLNAILEIQVNGHSVHNGRIHFRSHEETAAFWPWFDFVIDAALLRPGINTVTLLNKTSRATLGEFYEPRLDETLGAQAAEQKQSTLYLADVQITHVASSPVTPRLVAIPHTAIAGQPLYADLILGSANPGPIRILTAQNALIEILDPQLELGQWRAPLKITPQSPGHPITLSFKIADQTLSADIPHVYHPHNVTPLFAAPGMETIYQAQLQRCVEGVVEELSGTGIRISIDDYLNDLHTMTQDDWRPYIEYLVRRQRYIAMQRIRVPSYSKMQYEEMTALADLAGPLFAGSTVPEPVNLLHHVAELKNQPDLAKRLEGFKQHLRGEIKKYKLPGHTLVTFDCPGALASLHYELGIDIHIAELGPASNIFEEICARGASRAHQKPWGVATALLWYQGQGAQYAVDESRLRLVRQTVLSSYLAGARHVLFEGGVFDNIPVYQYISTAETWRDYHRRYHDAPLPDLRATLRDLHDLHKAQQLPAPTAHFGVIAGQNDMFVGKFDASVSRVGSLSLARSWTLLSAFLPHISWGRGPVDHGRPVRRWYSATPRGQVDVVPASSPSKHFHNYKLLTLASWNTMTQPLYDDLLDFVRQGGTLVAWLPHFVSNTQEELDWTFFNSGDFSSLLGLKVHGLGNRLESVNLTSPRFQDFPDLTLSEKNPLFWNDHEEQYVAFSQDITYFTGDISLCGAQSLAVSQNGDPVILSHKLGKGEVLFVNSWWHPGRGKLLDLAHTVLQLAINQTPTPISVGDNDQAIAWYEYTGPDFTRFVFLNTHWNTDEPAFFQVHLTAANIFIDLQLRPGKPLILATDGHAHLVLHDPLTQIASWQTTPTGIRRVALTGPGQERAQPINGGIEFV
jgi:hypothetical protein